MFLQYVKLEETKSMKQIEHSERKILDNIEGQKR